MKQFPWPELILASLAVGLALPLLLPLNAPPENDDFFLYATQHAIVRDGLLRQGRLPLETPAVAGGYPTVENPESPVLNPLVVLSLVFGEVAGLKLIYLFYAVLSGLGAWWLCRYSLGLSAPGAFFAAASLLFSALFPGKYVGGNLTEIPYLTLPLGLHLLLQSRRKKYFWALVGYGLLLAAEPKSAPLIVGMYLLLGAVLWDLIPPREKTCSSGHKAATRPQPNLTTEDTESTENNELIITRKSVYAFRNTPLTFLCFGALGLALLLAAVKLVPVAGFFHKQGGLEPEILSGHSSRYEDTVACTPLQFIRRLANPAMIARGVPLNHAIAIGPVVFLAALASLAVFPRLGAKLGFLTLLSGWLSCAAGARPDLFEILWRHVPFFNFIDKPGKYFGPPAAIFLCLMAGAFVSALSGRFRRKTAYLIPAILLALSAPFPLSIHLRCRKAIANLPPDFRPHPLPGGGFYQVENRAGLSVPLDPPNRAAPYYNFKRGVGTIDAFVPVSVPRRAVPRYFIVWPEGLPVPNPAYRGEIEQPPGKKAAGEIAWEPNRITVRLENASAEPVAINRNYDPDWRSGDGTVINHGGRLAVIPNVVGRKELRLIYRPRSLVIGAMISILTAVMCLASAWLKFNRE